MSYTSKTNYTSVIPHISAAPEFLTLSPGAEEGAEPGVEAGEEAGEGGEESAADEEVGEEAEEEAVEEAGEDGFEEGAEDAGEDARRCLFDPPGASVVGCQNVCVRPFSVVSKPILALKEFILQHFSRCTRLTRFCADNIQHL